MFVACSELNAVLTVSGTFDVKYLLFVAKVRFLHIFSHVNPAKSKSTNYLNKRKILPYAALVLLLNVCTDIYALLLLSYSFACSIASKYFTKLGSVIFKTLECGARCRC